MSNVRYVERDRLDDDRRRAYDDEQARVGRVTNMKKAILRSLPAYSTYRGFYGLQQAVRDLVGGRAFDVYAHAISTGSDCVLCSTYFRRQLREAGIEPRDFTPTPVEAVLVEVGRAIGSGERTLPPDLWRRLRQTFDEDAVVTLIAFAGTMVATNIFNSVLDIDLDDDLEPYREA